MTGGVPVDSEKGKKILAQAMRDEYTVLEFQTNDDGTRVVQDITDHMKQLERMQGIRSDEE
jgi:hypothetical protein